MDLSILKAHASRALYALLALTFCTGTAQAVLLKSTSTPTTIALTCNTATGAGASATIVVKPVAATLSSPITVGTSNAVPGVTVTAVAGNQLTSSNLSTGISYTVNITAAGCAGVTAQAATATLFNFTANSATDLAELGSITLTSSATALTAASSTVNLTCSIAVSNGAYTPGAAMTDAVTSTNPLGETYYVDTTTAVPAWLTVQTATGSSPTAAPTSSSPNTATTTSLGLSFVAASGCGGYSAGTTRTYTVTLDVDGRTVAPFQKTITVNLQISSGATQLTVSTSPSAISFTCDTKNGPSAPATVTVTSNTVLTGTLAVGIASSPATVAGITVSPTTGTLSPTVTSLTFTVKVSAAGCNGITTQASTAALFTFTAGGTNDASVNGAITVTTTNGTGLSPSLGTVALTCSLSGGTYVIGQSVTDNIFSTNSLGTPFYIDVTTAIPSWLTITPKPLVAGPATATPTTPTALALVPTTGSGSGMSAIPTCGGFAVGSVNSYTLTLDTVGFGAASNQKTITVTLTIVNPRPTLTLSPAAPTLTYYKGSGSPGSVAVSVASNISPAPFFSVDTSTLPAYLTVTPSGGHAYNSTGAAGQVLNFSTTAAADNVAPGTYTASIGLQISGDLEYYIPVKVQINNSAPTLTVVEGTTRNLTWQYGSATPSVFITAQSTDSPIPFTITTGGPLAPVVAANELTGLAYSFGTPIPVTFNPLVFASASPGTVLTGTVSLTWNNPTTGNVTTVVTFNYTVVSPAATVSGLSPATISTGVYPQTFGVTITGSGFSTNAQQKPTVGVVSGSTMTVDPNIVVTTVYNTSNMLVTISVPAAGPSSDPNLPFLTGGTVLLGVCNPGSGTCNTPTGTATLTISGGPQIQAISSSATFAQVTAPNTPNVSPYDMLSIFGTGFCTSNNSGCSSSTVLTGTVSPGSLQYATQVTPDIVSGPGAVANPRYLQVQFTDGTNTSYAPILFATNGQINVVAPSWITTANNGGVVNVTVSFGYGGAGGVAAGTLLQSPVYNMTAKAQDPGLYTVGADGQGGVAALNAATYATINSTNPAAVRGTASTSSDIISLYASGFGAPTESANAASTGVAPASCLSVAQFITAVDNVTPSTAIPPTTLDGVIMQAGLIGSNQFAPCLSTMPQVKIGGVAGTVSYAGWVSDAVAGLYQINVQLPAANAAFVDVNGTSVTNLATPVALPVQVAFGSSFTAPLSQLGTTLYVSKQLSVAPNTTLTLSGSTVAVGVAYSSGLIKASLGTAPFSMAVTSGLLPAGLTLNTVNASATASTGTFNITGTPLAGASGSYTLTVTATDSSVPPISGSYTFTIVIGGGLYVTSSAISSLVSPVTMNYGTANTSVSTFSANGGTYPYTYAITSPGSIPPGMTIGTTSGILGVSNVTPAGNYTVLVTATDATLNVMGSATLYLDVNLGVSQNVVSSLSAATINAAGGPTPVATLTSTGGTGTPTFALVSPPTGFTITNATGTGTIKVSNSASIAAGTYTLTVTATDSTTPKGADGVTAAGTAGTATTTVSVIIGS